MADETNELRVLRGSPSPEELAAVLAVLLTTRQEGGPPPRDTTQDGARAPWEREHHVTHRHAGSWKFRPA